MLKYLKTKSIPKKKWKKKQKYLFYIFLGVLWVIVIPILAFIVQVAPVLNNKWLYLLFANGFMTIFIVPIFSMVVLFAGPVGVIIFIVSLFQKLQRMVLRTVGLILVFNFLFCYGAGKLAVPVRDIKLAAAAEKVMPVITGLQAYHTEYKKYPNSLLDLIPKYLDALPTSTIFAFPNIEYEKTDYVSGTNLKSTRDNPQSTWQRYYTGGYELRFVPASNSSNFDRFIYWPQKVYPKYMYDGTAEPVGTWMFVRE
jgi:hypothetical protein